MKVKFGELKKKNLPPNKFSKLFLIYFLHVLGHFENFSKKNLHMESLKTPPFFLDCLIVFAPPTFCPDQTQPPLINNERSLNEHFDFSALEGFIETIKIGK